MERSIQSHDHLGTVGCGWENLHPAPLTSCVNRDDGPGTGWLSVTSPVQHCATALAYHDDLADLEHHAGRKRATPEEDTAPGISVDTAGQGCGVTVLPATSDSTDVIVRLDGTLHCSDAGTCDELAATGGSTAQLSRPEDNGAGGESLDSETPGELGREDSDATAEPTSSG